jgi:hypothetical protein
MDIPFVKANEFFLEKSFRSKHPSFKKIKASKIDNDIMLEDMIPLKSGKGNAYRYTKTGYREDIRIECKV